MTSNLLGRQCDIQDHGVVRTRGTLACHTDQYLGVVGAEFFPPNMDSKGKNHQNLLATHVHTHILLFRSSDIILT